MMRKIVLGIILVLSVAQTQAEAKVALRFPFKMALGISSDTAIATMAQKGLVILEDSLSFERGISYTLVGETYLSKDIPVVRVRLDFFDDRLFSVDLFLYTLVDASEQLDRVGDIDKFIRSTYFLDSTSVSDTSVVMRSIANMKVIYYGGRMYAILTSFYDPFTGYELTVNYRDKWAEDRIGRELK